MNFFSRTGWALDFELARARLARAEDYVVGLRRFVRFPFPMALSHGSEELECGSDALSF